MRPPPFPTFLALLLAVALPVGAADSITVANPSFQADNFPVLQSFGLKC